MSGGHFKSRRKKLFLRKIHGDGKVKFEEKVSPFTSSTSKDPTLIAKCDKPKIQGHCHSWDRIVKSIQIQTGAGKAEKKEITEKDTQEKSDSDISDTDSSISLDFDNQVVKNGNTLESTKRTEVEVESETLATKEEERPSKKIEN